MRPFTHIIIWAASYPDRIRSARHYVITTHGDRRDIKAHRTVRASTIERNVSKALANGQMVTFETSKPDFTRSQCINVQLTR